jgi:ABC-type antimicrobial peptide transport system permease subunit
VTSVAYASEVRLPATIGICGVVAQVVAERIPEIGIRMALGAGPSHILAHFLGRGLRSGLLGLLCGLAAAAYVQRWLAGLLSGVKAFDPATLVSASAGILTRLLLAVWGPARRASRVNVQQALRNG